MNRALKISFWVLLWMATGYGIFYGMREADYTFLKFMDVGEPSLATACDLIPANVQAFACDVHFRENWKEFRKSSVYPSIRGLSVFREACEGLRLGDRDLTALEQWISQYWGSGVVAAYSRENEALYLLSPVGRREECVEWFRRMRWSPFGQHITWTPRIFDLNPDGKVSALPKNLWCFEADGAYFSTPGYNIQFHAIHGVAVLAISRKKDPLLDILRTDAAPDKSLAKSAGFSEFFAQGLQHPERPFGFVRLGGDTKSADGLGARWSVVVEKDGRVALDVRIPAPTIAGSMVAVSQFDLLARLRQPDDLVSTVFSWEDAQTLWKEGQRRLPSAWTATIREGQVDAALGSYKDIWKPILDKLGHEMFVGFGDSSVISEKYRVPFPRTIVAVPFTDSVGFIKALEATVQKCNREQEANLVIRKGGSGDYYEVRMGSAAWQARHGMKELPVFAISNGLLILAPGGEVMEKALKTFSENASRPVEKTEGLEIRLNLRKSPGTVRILLAALGLLNPQGDNVFLTPSMMHSMSELFALMEQFGDSRLTLTYAPGFLQVHAAINP